MNVTVRLTQAVHNLGEAGEIKRVSKGFARNYLLPLGLAELQKPENKPKTTTKKRKQN